jgi:putative ABC transport system permease protein
MIRPGIRKLFRLAFHRREDAVRDVRDEIRLHVELRTEQLIGGGMAPDAARAEAERRFGSLDDAPTRMKSDATHREAVMNKRDWWESFVQDLRYVLRSLKRSPTFVVSATLTLALGLGANAALFSILDRLYLQAPAGVPAPDQLKRLYSTYSPTPQERQILTVVSPPQYFAVAAAIPRGSSIAGYRTTTKVHLGKDDTAPLGGVTWVLGDYFGTVGVGTAAGRNFTAAEVHAENISLVAIVSSKLARDRFGSERDALNKDLDIGKVHYTIVGVAPAGFAGTDLDASDVWVPMNSAAADAFGAPRWYEQTGTAFIEMMVRAADNASAARIPALAAGALRHGWAWGDTSAVGATFASIRQMLSPGFSASEGEIATRLGVVAFAIFLIACANVANLLLARALQRRREIGVRLALGVSRRRLVSQLLTESVVLALIGGVAALVMAVWVATALRNALLPNVDWSAPAIGLRAVVFGALSALIAGVAAGLAPALHASRPDLTNVLRGGSRDGATQRSRVRGGLLVAQIALSCVLLAGAGLFVRSLRQVEAIDIGYDTGRIVLAGIDFTRDSGRKPEEAEPLYASAASRIERLPGVERVAFTENTPFSSISFEDTFSPNGDALTTKEMEKIVSFISPGYFASMGMHVIEGRDFAPTDRYGSEPVLVVNANFAKAVWPDMSAVGQCFRLHKPTDPCRRVIGVVSNSHFGGVIERPSAQFFVPLAQEGDGGKHAYPGTMEIRTAPGRAAAVAGQVKQLLLQLLLQLSGSGMRPWAQTFSEQIDGNFRSWRLGAALFTAASLLALLVAGVGIYGTITYTFSQRTQEIGVRIALGAQGSSIIALVLKSSVVIAAVGVVIGTGVALWAGRFAKPLLYETSPNDPFVLAGVGLVLLAVAVTASLVPALRARRVDPMEALRAE